jgi:hypothetical protein
MSSAGSLFSVLLVLNCVRWLLLRSKSGFAQQQRSRLTLEIQALRRQAEVGWTRGVVLKLLLAAAGQHLDDGCCLAGTRSCRL